MIVLGWQDIDELVEWCTQNIGHIIWTNSLTDWVGSGWSLTRIKDGFDLQVTDDELEVLSALRWS